MTDVSSFRGGDVLAGKYRVEKVLGQGAMGVVVAAQHVQLGHRVAIKYLLPHSDDDPEAIARFLREARSAVQIQSEHVARVTDVGTFESGAPYIVMEFLSGADLGQVLRDRTGPLEVEQAVDFLLQACEAVAEAHALGIVHRDLKPANLFLTERADGSPLVKVLDFGISKATLPDPAGGASGSMTSSTALLGSPTYMSPEQIRSSKNVDARSDIWALGVVLYEFLTGVAPFQATSVAAILAQIAADPPPPLREARPDVAPELERVVLRCLAKNPARRIQNVAELAKALLPFAPPGAQVSVDRIGKVLGSPKRSALASSLPPLSRAVVHAMATLTEWGATNRFTRRRRIALGAVAGLFALAVILYEVRVRREGRASETPEAIAQAASGQASPTPSIAASTQEAIAAAVLPAPPAPASAEVKPAPPERATVRPRTGPAKAGLARPPKGAPSATAPRVPEPRRNVDLFNDTQ